MKKIMLTVAQLALLVKVEEVVGFTDNKLNDFIYENQDKEDIPELEVDENGFSDLLDSLEIFDGEEQDNANKETWLEELNQMAEEEPTDEEEK